MSCATPNVKRRTLNAERKASEVGRDCPGLRSLSEGDRARRDSRKRFYTKIAKNAKPVKVHPIPICFGQKIAKSGWYFCYQRQKQSMLGNLVRADAGLFVPFATFV
jgi:hypothetical protein